MSILRTAFSVAALGVLSVTGAGVAAAADASTPPIVPFATLPTGKIAPPPKKAPWSIGGGERVSGLHVRKESNGPTVLVSGSLQLLEQNFGRGRTVDEDEDTTRDYCMSEGNLQGFDGESGPEWQPTANPMIGLFSRGRRENVTAVHMEHVVDETAAGAVLEIVDAWVDVSTSGVRLIGRSKLSLKQVATAPGDVRVYAARESDRVHFVLVEPRQRPQGWSGILQVGNQMAQSGCRHARGTLPLERGGADTTTFIVNTQVVTDDAPPSTEVAAVLPSEMKAESVRSRPLRVHASASWGSQDAEPVLAVSMGWEARDRTSTSFRTLKKRR